MPIENAQYVDARGASINQIHGPQYNYFHNPENGSTIPYLGPEWWS
jgi:hypothetical protein